MRGEQSDFVSPRRVSSRCMDMIADEAFWRWGSLRSGRSRGIIWGLWRISIIVRVCIVRF